MTDRPRRPTAHGHFRSRSPERGRQRELPLDPDPTKAKALVAALKIYPYSRRANPDPTQAYFDRSWVLPDIELVR